MTKKKNIHSVSLQINEDMAFQSREWLFERIGWTVMGLLAIAAILGLFGKGLFSNTHTASDTLAVSYDTFARRDAPTTLTVSLKNSDELIVDDSFFQDYKVESIQPEPNSIRYSDQKIHFIFSSSNALPDKKVIFQLQPSKIGAIQKQIATEKKGGITLNQIVYP